MDSRTEVLAQLRGAAVGSLSGAVGIAAHGLAGGGLPPSESALVLLLAVCAVVGATVSTLPIRDRDTLVLIAALTAGQVPGHLTLTFVDEHAHGLELSVPMLAAHVAAVAVCAGIVRGCEWSCLQLWSATVRVVLAALTLPPAPTDIWSVIPAYRATVLLWLLISAGAGTRAPPARA